jgi:hypothetical protein
VEKKYLSMYRPPWSEVDRASERGVGWWVTGQGGWQESGVVGQGWAGVVGERDGGGSGQGWW